MDGPKTKNEVEAKLLEMMDEYKVDDQQFQCIVSLLMNSNETIFAIFVHSKAFGMRHCLRFVICF